jgi:dTMP kinase
VERGLLIVFEGLDGCGKSTQLALLFELLCERFPPEQRPVIRTKEPTDGPVGRRIREMARSAERVTPEQELEWFMEDRREHARDVLEPGLAKGAIVLSDRYWLSNVAYQGARGLDVGEILRANQSEFPDPDLVLIFEIAAAVGLARVRARGGIGEPAFEEIEFLSRAGKIYRSIDLPWIKRIDASPPVADVHRVVVEVVAELVVERFGGAGITSAR